MSDGSTQDARLPAALRTDTVPVDGRDLAALIAATVRIASATPRVDGIAADWSGLLARDEAAVIAAGVAMGRDFADSDVDGATPEQLDHHVARLVTWLGTWLAAVAAIDGARGVALAARLDRDVDAALGHGWRGWRDDKAASRDRLTRLTAAIRTARRIAEAALPEGMASGAHDPAAGLLLVLAQVYGTVQAYLNGFQARHLAFYYDDVLGTRAVPAEPDSVHLVCARDPLFAGDALVPAGTVFTAGKDAGGTAILFTADETLAVTDARVVALKTIRVERDPLIVPNNIMGLATSASAASFTPVVAVGPGAAAAAIFGGDVPGCVSARTCARIGIAVSSPILWLAEGARTIDVRIDFACPRRDLAAAATPAEVRTWLGGLFARWLFGGEVTSADLAIVRSRAADDLAGLTSDGRAGDPAVALVRAFVDPERAPTSLEVIAAAVLPGLFEAEASVASGWARLPDPVYLRRTGVGIGLQFVVNAAMPAIVPAVGEPWPEDAPTLRLTLDPRSRLYGLSLFDDATLQAVRIDVAVDGLRDLQLHNQFGQVDGGKPFKPFGPLPDAGSFLVVGAAEIARKAPKTLAVTLEWSGVPANYARFDTSYGSDPAAPGPATLRVQPAVLRDGRWITLPPALPLFDDVDGTISARQTLAPDPRRLAASWRPGEPVAWGPVARNGLVRFDLVTEPAAFGHAAYPVALSQAARDTGRRPRALPLPPYTPLLANVALRYTASTTIALGTAQPHERIMHLHPFGVQTVHPAASGRRPAVLPLPGGDGQLLIGLAATSLTGILTLMFELRADTARDRLVPLPPAKLQWWWLADDLWTPLPPSRILGDGTRGFLRSGIVKLDLPAGAATGNTIVPAELFWLRVTTDRPSDAFAGVAAVHAHAVRAHRRPGTEPLLPLPAATITARSAVLPGIVTILQPEPSFGLRRAETERRRQTRVAERLRHKGRASTAWDYERLVLEQFPGVYKVRCLANTAVDRPLVEVPGAVLVVVVPSAPATQRGMAQFLTRPLRLPANDLAEIEAFLRTVCSPLAAVRVINATYEFIEVRCRIVFAPGIHPGGVLAEINAAITRYLSPWSGAGRPPLFDWTLRLADVAAFIRNVDPGIVAVTGLSLIRTWQDEFAGTFGLDDTAPSASPVTAIHSLRPWSLIMPLPDHIVATADGNAAAEVTGMADDGRAQGGDPAGLRIDETFIIGVGE